MIKAVFQLIVSRWQCSKSILGAFRTLLSANYLLFALVFLLGKNVSFSQGQAKGQIIDYALYNQGIEFKNLGKYPDAILSFGKFIQQYPSEYPEAYYQRGKSYLLLNQFDQAILDFQQVIQLDKVNKEVPYQLGKIFFQQKKYIQAFRYFTQSIQLNADHALSYNDRGLVQCQLRKFDQALADFSTATRLDPTFAMAFNNAGAARYFKQDIAKPTSKDLREAKAWFSKAIQIDPTLALAYRNRASMSILTGDYKSVFDDLKKAQKLNPNDAMTVFYLGVAYADTYKAQRAFDAFKKVLEINPQLAIAHEEMGNLYKLTKQFEYAVYQYELAKTARPNTGSLYKGLLNYRIALVYAEQKNAPQMYTYLKKARELGAFKDQQLYRDFQKAMEFKPFRLEKSFQRFQKSLFKIKRDNKFLNPDLGWFRMRK